MLTTFYKMSFLPKIIKKGCIVNMSTYNHTHMHTLYLLEFRNI